MHFTTPLLAFASLLSTASAHYYIKSIDGQTSCLRPLPLYQENFPVDQNNIDTTQIICGASNAYGSSAAKTPCNYPAGGTIKAQYDTGVFHAGPCTVYIAKPNESPLKWAKIYQDGYSNGKWCSDIINANGNVQNVAIPSQISGHWLFRVEHLGLHGAGSPGGAQFYIRCMDINVTGGQGQEPTSGSYVSLPGAFTKNTSGVVWNLYNGDQTRYPSFGGPIAQWGSGSGGNPQTTTTRTTTTTQQQQPTTTTTRTTQQQQPTTTTTTRATTTTTTASNGGNCVAIYGQCGGQGYTGPTCCSSGTCKFSNTWYSQCL